MPVWLSRLSYEPEGSPTATIQRCKAYCCYGLIQQVHESLGLSSVGKMYMVCSIMQNALSCMYGNKTRNILAGIPFDPGIFLLLSILLYKHYRKRLLYNYIQYWNWYICMTMYNSDRWYSETPCIYNFFLDKHGMSEITCLNDNNQWKVIIYGRGVLANSENTD